MKKIAVMILFALFAFGMWLPSESSASAAEPQWREGRQSDRRWRSSRSRRRSGRWYGYKNYGQYRRTQVGNRRFRMRRQYYYRNGIRLSRFVRVYY